MLIKKLGKLAVHKILRHSGCATEIHIIFILIYLWTVFTLHIRAERTTVTGVVKSAIVLPCERNVTLDINIVEWKVNFSEHLLLWYFPSHAELQPPNRDQRFNIMDRTALTISSLQKADTGIYECTSNSLTMSVEEKSEVFLNVLDGCRLWEFTSPLLSEDEGCSSGAIMYYKEMCTFSCHLGFYLVGNNSTTCMDDGSLNSSEPHCDGTGLNCTIDNLPPHLSDENGVCERGAIFHHKLNCSFVCEAGYFLRGNQTVTLECLVNGSYSTIIPTCDNMDDYTDHQYYLASLIAIPILGLVACGIHVHCSKSNKKRGRENRTNHEDEQFGTQNEEDPRDENPNEEAAFLLTTFNPTAPEAPADAHQEEKQNIRGQYDFLREQLRFEAFTSILDILQNAECRLMEYSHCEIEEEIYVKLRDSIKTIKDAFAWYTFIVIKCISSSDEDLGDSVFNDVISASGMFESERSSTESADTATWDTNPCHIAENENAEMYLNTIHSALIHLLIAGRKNLPKEEIANRTSKVFRGIKVFFKQKRLLTDKTEPKPFRGSSSRSRSTTLSPKLLEALRSDDSDTFFAQKCVESVSKCSTVVDAITIRYIILEALLGEFDHMPTEQVDECLILTPGEETTIGFATSN